MNEAVAMKNEPEMLFMINCSFCGKSTKEVKQLIVGPCVSICDECGDLCTEIIAEERAKPFHDLRNAP